MFGEGVGGDNTVAREVTHTYHGVLLFIFTLLR